MPFVEPSGIARSGFAPARIAPGGFAKRIWICRSGVATCEPLESVASIARNTVPSTRGAVKFQAKGVLLSVAVVRTGLVCVRCPLAVPQRTNVLVRLALLTVAHVIWR